MPVAAAERERLQHVDPTSYDSRLHPLSAITMLLTEQCNLRCDYCYIHKAARRMSAEIARRSVDFLFAQASPAEGSKLAICFFGGEPLLEPRLLADTADYATSIAGERDIRLHFSITSNATLLDQHCLDILRKFRIQATFSLDGIGPAHDKHRKTVSGQGSFALLENNIERMLALEGCTIRLTVTPETAPALEESVRWLVEKGFRRISISPVLEAGWSVESFSAYHSAWERIYCLYGLPSESGERRSAIVNIEKNERNLCNPGHRTWGCGAARSMVAIDAAGYLYPCHRFIGYFKNSPNQRIGHVALGFDHSRRAYYIESNHLSSHTGCGSGLFPTRRASEVESGICSECSFSSICGSNCMAVNEHMSGDPRTPHAVNRIFSQIHASVHLQHHLHQERTMAQTTRPA